MQNFRDKTAVITGAASGIGLATARLLAVKGMQVALLDNREDTLAKACRELEEEGYPVLGQEVDIRYPDAVNQAADTISSRFGSVNLLINNAAVFIRGHGITEVEQDVWDWLMDVNLRGTLNCLRTFLPLMQANGEEGHVVNTCSISGLVVRDRKNGIYATSKFALVGLSEALAFDLAGTPINVSVLIPGAVASDFYLSSAEHRGSLGGPNLFPDTPEDTANGMSPADVAERLIDGIRHKRFYITTHAANRAMVEQKYRELMAAFDAAESFET